MCPSMRLILESRGQQMCNPFVELPGEDWVGMHRQPDILPIAPHIVGQADSHRWRTLRAALPQAFMGQHKVVETDQEPDFAPVTAAAPG